MKKILLSSLVIAGLFAASTNTNSYYSVNKLNMQLNKLQKEINHLKHMTKRNHRMIRRTSRSARRTRAKLNPIFTNSHLYFGFDLRTAGDFIEYKMSNGKKYTNNVFSNRVNVTGVARPSDNLKATLVLSANNIFGMNNENKYSPNQNAQWTANESPNSSTNLRVKEAFFNYTFGPGLMLEAGRSPSTEGFPMNLEENDGPNAPISHLINIEFDGGSFTVSNQALNKILPGVDKYGSWLKVCLGRGYSSSVGKYPNPSNGQPAYTKSNLGITDFAGFIFVPYDNGQYSLETQQIWAWNVKGYQPNGKMADLGDYFGDEIMLKAKGIGNGDNMFLYNTTAFIDFAFTKTNPYSGKQMQGSIKDKTGNSIWVGAQMPGIGNNDTFGFNFIHGSKYFRPMDYSEDTLVGSMASVRGNAYDIYYNKQIIPHLTAGLRGTYMRYLNSGSDGFFGVTSSPNQKLYATKAADIRAYIRYNF